jgi:hypothetical protein
VQRKRQNKLEKYKKEGVFKRGKAPLLIYSPSPVKPRQERGTKGVR